MERNLRLYPLYQGFRSGFFWLPVFFLYFLSVLSLEQAIALEALYYLAAVLLEVPSGYFSDRVGRRTTLLVATASGTLSALVFASTAAFLPFAVAQVLRAVSNAFNSGTDTSLLYDSLAELGRQEEIGAHESRAYAWGLFSASGACLVGGLAAGLDLRLAWLLTAAADLAALAVAWRFAEPGRGRARHAPRGAAATVWQRVRARPLAWLFVYAVAMVVLNHVPFEFFQPYLALLFGAGDAQRYAATPAVAGALASAMWLLGAAAALRAMRIRTRLGVGGALLAGMALQTAIVAGMAAWLSPWVMLLIAGRSVPMALAQPIVHAEIHPRVPSGVRATYLSLQSLAGRLVFSGCLALVAKAVAGEPTGHAALAGVLSAFAIAGCALLLLLSPRAPGLRRRPTTPAAASD